MEFAEDLDLELAWQKTRRDFNHHMNSFVRSPYVLEILDRNKEEWLSDLRERLTDSEGGECEYNIHPPQIVDVPKSGYHLRPASVLYIEDVVVYSAIMLELYDDIRDEISWSAENRRFSHILHEDKSEDNQWQKFERDRWTAMQDAKISFADEYNWVLETDVSGFYENIDIERAISVLRQMSDRDAVVIELWNLLADWAEPRKRGVPQGYGPSDLIAEVYLDSVDRQLKNHQYRHVRFNDDFVVFCTSRDQAIDAQNLLEREFRSKGLNMKTGKTEIRKADDAKSDYEEPESIFQELKSEIASPPPAASPYGGGTWARSSSGSNNGSDESREEEIDEEALKRAYRKHIDGIPFSELETHLFRYIINNLGEIDSSIAFEYCRDYIKDGQPDVRRIIYDYFDDLSSADNIVDSLANSIANGEIRYNYHIFVIIRWFFERQFSSPQVLHAARSVLDTTDPLQTRDYAIAILGEFGNYSDWENIERMYNSELRPISKAIMAYAIRNTEPRHREGFYDRIDTTHHMTENAIEAAREDIS